MSVKWAAAIASGTLLLGCAAGGALAYWYGESRVSALEAAHAAATALAQQTAMAELAEVQRQNAETLRQYEQAKAKLEKSNASLVSTARGLRNQLAAVARDRKAGTGNSGFAGSTGADRLSQCEQLLGEGAELLAEGTVLYSGCAARGATISKWKQ